MGGNSNNPMMSRQINYQQNRPYTNNRNYNLQGTRYQGHYNNNYQNNYQQNNMRTQNNSMGYNNMNRRPNMFNQNNNNSQQMDYVLKSNPVMHHDHNNNQIGNQSE